MTASSSASWIRLHVDNVVVFLKADDAAVVSYCYVPDDVSLGCRETLYVELKDAQGRADF